MSASRSIATPVPVSSSSGRLRSVFATVLMLVACTAFAQKQQVTVTRTTTALPGPRYAYVAMPASASTDANTTVQSPEFRERLQQALDNALQAKGYRRVEGASEADFLVAYRVGVEQVDHVDVKDVPAPRSGPVPQAAIECRAGGCSQLVTADSAGVPTLRTTTTQSTEGSLLIEVIEPKTIRVLWRARDQGKVTRRDGQQSRLDAIARQTLDDLPALPR